MDTQSAVSSLSKPDCSGPGILNVTVNHREHECVFDLARFNRIMRQFERTGEEFRTHMLEYALAEATGNITVDGEEFGAIAVKWVTWNPATACTSATIPVEFSRYEPGIGYTGTFKPTYRPGQYCMVLVRESGENVFQRGRISGIARDQHMNFIAWTVTVPGHDEVLLKYDPCCPWSQPEEEIKML